ncbi:DUF559 domain-containing protein [Microbacterium sp. W1N]|uniref:type IV toxin-antitoxin system AbiEi family antitoxin domain-containing protein n=1 Tax=Microbacterium festucae TaxID=2977531 RepID=UPI0021C023CC|nr:type IV toxin-antitoxin system AbiEi family antitoxin domain-containing protein [Microbacterium festucae]MCT9818874.1 DUF559 domain-containing protein [Microbacterium festucae]
MDVAQFVASRGGVVHRAEVIEAGASPGRIRAAVLSGEVERLRRSWLATATAPPLLRTAATASGRLACLSAARHRGWWVPPQVEDLPHLHLHPHAAVPAVPAVLHWTIPLVPSGPRALVESVVDTLEHVARCQPRETALVLWESALAREDISLPVLRSIDWRSTAARMLTAEVTGRMASGLESIFAARLRRWGLDVRVQVLLAGHEVDALIGERLVVQLDGFAFHSSSADRTRDVAHDRELAAQGYTVLRFTYADVLHHWPRVRRAISLAIAQGRHLAA